jgi:tetratricopeptide (TPR) repeat protein
MQQQQLASFDQFQQLVDWLTISTQAPYRGRLYLESHPELLQASVQKELARLLHAHADDPPAVQQPLRDHLLLLTDACQRGASPEALCTAYINLYGGLSLELPAHLQALEAHRAQLIKIRRPDRTNRLHIRLLRCACAQVPSDQPEIKATLLNELGRVLAHSTHYSSQEQFLQALEEAMHCYETAGDTFASDYPLQFAHTASLLAEACYLYAREGYVHEIERALACYETALRGYTREHFPEDWARLLSCKGRVYTLLGQSKQAIEYHEAALQVLNPQDSTQHWAEVQGNLGDALCQQATEQTAVQTLFQAMSCYLTALRAYSPATPAWASIHVRLAGTYQQLAQQTGQQDTYLRCALVCYESALQVYDLISYPLTHQRTQEALTQCEALLAEPEPQKNWLPLGSH